MQATIAGGGVIPHIHKSLINKQVRAMNCSDARRPILQLCTRLMLTAHLCQTPRTMQGKKEGMP